MATVDSDPKMFSKRGTITESVAPSIAARSGLSVASVGHKYLPDPVKIARDIRNQLKSTEVSYGLKNQIVTATKDAEVLINCHKVLGPYLRRCLVDLRQALKKKTDFTNAVVEEQFQLFMDKLDKVNSKRYQIIEAAEAKKVAVNKKSKTFQVVLF